MAVFAALVMLAATSTVAVAAGQPWACQFTATGGLLWKNGQWKPSGFNTGQPFVLVQDGDVLTQKSAMTAMMGVAVGIDTREMVETFYKLVSCQRKDGTFGHQIFCRDPNGGALVFSPTTGQGGVSKIFGLMDNNPKRRDTPLVSPFACQKY
jgi:hypothetical protein